MRVTRGGRGSRVSRSCAWAVAAGLVVLLPGISSVAVPGVPGVPVNPVASVTSADAPRPAGGRPVRQSHGKTSAALVIETIDPKTVRPKSRITVTGYVQNESEQRISGVSVRLRWRARPLTSRTELAQYAGTSAPTLPLAGRLKPLSGPIPAGGRATWRLETTAQQLGAVGFGVHPIAVEAVTSAGTLAGRTTFLPSMPAAKSARPKPTKVAWVWPLLDRPRRAADATFTDDRLEVDLAAGGRLDTLVQAVRNSHTPVTWAIDPALLDDTREMTKGYTLKNAKHPKGTSRPKSKAAEGWLNLVRTAGTPYFTMPYADPDAVALVRQRMSRHLNIGYRSMGVAGEVLGRPPSAAICWPVGGTAGQQTLDGMADNGCGTFLMSSDVLLATGQSGTTGGATTRLEAAGQNRRTLVFDATISDVVSTDTSAPGAALLAEQRFLAETALFTAEQPNRSRTLVIAPARRWNPERRFADALLSYTAKSQWLKAVPLTDVEKAAPAPRTFTGYPAGAERHELGATYLKNVREVSTAAARFSVIFTPPVNAYELAVLRMESSWWRGRDRQARAFRQTIEAALDSDIGQVHLVTNKRIGLAGNSGFIPITVANDLTDRTVGVVLRVTTQNPRRLMIGGGSTVDDGTGREWLLRIGPERKETVRVPVEANANGYTDLSLELLAPQPRRRFSQNRSITVHTTGYGRTALLITGGALAVLFLGVGARVLRTRRRTEAEESDGSGIGADTGPSAGPDAGPGADEQPGG